MDISFALEQDLIVRARSGDESAFEQLVEAFTPHLFRVVRRMVADTGEAEAIIQETFWRVWQALPRYKEDRRFFPYLVTIAANLMRDAWRKEHRVLPDEFDAIVDHFDELPSPEMQVVEAELLHSLTRAVEELPPLYRAIIALRYDAGLSYEGIASAMDLPLNTVRTYLYRAKSALHKSLKEAYG